MKSATFKCKVITPMFMAGADGRTPELRPSEFKGMIRFWWRAIKAKDSIEELRKEEAGIFGGTGKGEGKSKINVTIFGKEIKDNKYRPLPHSNNKEFTFPAIMPGSKFEIVLLSRFDAEYELCKDVFVISTILGGFGKRSRRGFGSIKILDSEEITLAYIMNLLNKIEDSFSIQNNKIINKKRGGKYPWIKEIEIGKAHNDSNKLLKNIGQASHNHKDPSLGNAKTRMASPIYVSVVEIGSKYCPIVTTLNNAFPQNYPAPNLSKQYFFKKEIL